MRAPERTYELNTFSMGNKETYIFTSAFLLLAANLLIGNNFTSLWSGAEAFLAWRAAQGQAGAHLAEQVLALTQTGAGLDLIAWRMPGAILALLSGVAYYIFSRRLVGQKVVLYTLALCASSLLLPNLAKLGTADIWGMLLPWLAYAALIRYLKQPEWSWQLGFYIVFALAIGVAPLSSLVFIGGAAAWLYFLHPDGQRLWRLNPWAAGLAIAGIAHLAQWLAWDSYAFYFSGSWGRYLLFNLLGVLPFLGFVASGVWEHFQRLRGKEEFAVLYAGGLLFALLGQSLALQPILAMIAARQMQNYFDGRFPYRGIVKGGGVLHLVAAACGLILILIGGFFLYGGAGFRAGLAASGLYWALSFVAVIGLVGLNRVYVLLGTFFSGILLTTFFWLQFSPLMEGERKWVQDITEGAAGYDAVWVGQEGGFPATAVYALQQNSKTAVAETPERAQEVLEAGPDNTLLLLPLEWMGQADTSGLELSAGLLNPFHPAIWVRVPLE